MSERPSVHLSQLCAPQLSWQCSCKCSGRWRALCVYAAAARSPRAFRPLSLQQRLQRKTRSGVWRQTSCAPLGACLPRLRRTCAVMPRWGCASKSSPASGGSTAARGGSTASCFSLLSGPHGELGAAAAAAFLADDTPEVRRLRDSGDSSVAALGVRNSRELAAARNALQRAYPAVELCTPEDLAAPAWFRSQCSASKLPPAEVALSRAPLYIRVQLPGAEAELRAELAQLGVSVREVPQLLGAWELRCETPDVDLTATDGYQAGVFEVQDLGSQTLLAVVAPEPGGKWLDACAGAGGKALQLAALLGPNGRVTACDVRETALRELRRRARRAQLESRITTLQYDWASNASGAGGDLFDGVLVDAPCTGSGTWRRQPHLRWLLTPEEVAVKAQQQLQILHATSKRLRPGGLLVYATCSLADAENGGVVDAFLQSAPFEPVPLPRASALGLSAPDGRLTISPELLNSDGFFVAVMRRAT